jgi:uncharacterized membrane protein
VQDRRRNVATWILAAVLALSILSVGYLAANPALTTTGQTELYFPDAGNTTTTTSEPGATVSLTVGIANHEHHPVTYRLVATTGGTELAARSIRLVDGDRRNVSIPITAPTDPGRYRIDVTLYYEDGTDSELTIWRWIRVRS